MLWASGKAIPGSRRALFVFATMAVYCCSSEDREFPVGDESGGAGGTSTSGSGGSSSNGGSAQEGGASGSGTNPEGGAGGEPEPEPCGGIVCMNGGACVADTDTFTCDCDGTGYEGETCDVNIDECDDSPCQNDGMCEDTDGSYVCNCDPTGEYTGRNCDLLRLEPLPEGFSPAGLSPDGSVVVGSVDGQAKKYANGTATDLGRYVGDSNSEALGVSTNGAVIVGTSGTGVILSPGRAVFWAGGKITPLDMPEGVTRCEASDVSADGRVIVGTCDSQIVRWVDEELDELGIAEDVDLCRDAVVSDDGTTIGGSCTDTMANSARGFIWTEADGFGLVAGLETAAGTDIQDLSADGTKAAGVAFSGGSYARALYWSAADGSSELVAFDDQTGVITASAISGDGTFVVGFAANTGAAVWSDPSDVSVSLIDLLPATLPQLDLWSLSDAVEVSADAKTIVGTGSYDGTSTNFIARIE